MVREHSKFLEKSAVLSDKPFAGFRAPSPGADKNLGLVSAFREARRREGDSAPLTVVKIRAVKAGDSVRKPADRSGLQLWLKPTGGTLRRYACRFAGD